MINDVRSFRVGPMNERSRIKQKKNLLIMSKFTSNNSEKKTQELQLDIGAGSRRSSLKSFGCSKWPSWKKKTMAGACLIVESKASRVTSAVQASMKQSTPEGRTPLQPNPIKVDFQLWKFGPFLLIDFYKNLKIIKSGGSHTHRVNRYVLQLQLNAASLSIHYRCNIERGAKISHCAVPSTTIISATFH